MNRRARLLHALSTCSFLLGLLLAAPGILLLLAASQIMGMAVDRELEGSKW
jgi:flagellar biosynthesis protein FliR